MKSKVWCFVFGVLLTGQVAWGADRVKLELVGQCTVAGGAGAIAVQDDYAYLLAGERLEVINIADHRNPFRTGTVDCPSGSWRAPSWPDFPLVDHTVYVLDERGLQLLDVRDPAQPTIGPHIAVDGPGVVATIGPQIVWLGITTFSECSIIDITEPDDVNVLSTISGLGCLHSLTIQFPRLYIGGHSGGNFSFPGTVGSWSGARIYDISNLSKPMFLGQTTGVGWLDQMLPHGSHLYGCSAWRSSVNYILDVHDASQPLVVAKGGVSPSLPFNNSNPLFGGGGAYYSSLQLSGNVLSGQGNDDGIIYLSDVGEPDAPLRLGECALDSISYTIKGDVLYSVSGDDVFGVYHITELPAITRQFVQNGKLNLQWNEPAKGMILQRSTSLENPDWQSLEGSESTTSAELPLWGGQEYFRLIKPE